ncbi:hypothetical protein EYF80_041959 [Liparis tanakae]|uniref:Uncharacterized protein n=1 Tax=Liparis tanakae TaxID=230148 RepID=A0A4Z2G2M2_9TELE|nr:hypothetical protein EYF80_041959 [Liparis tanakae]
MTGERLAEGQDGDVPAVVVDAGVHEGQVAAVVDDGAHLHHVAVDGFAVDGAEQHAPAVHEAVPPGGETDTALGAVCGGRVGVAVVAAWRWCRCVGQQKLQIQSERVKTQKKKKKKNWLLTSRRGRGAGAAPRSPDAPTRSAGPGARIPTPRD